MAKYAYGWRPLSVARWEIILFRLKLLVAICLVTSLQVKLSDGVTDLYLDFCFVGLIQFKFVVVTCIELP